MDEDLTVNSMRAKLSADGDLDEVREESSNEDLSNETPEASDVALKFLETLVPEIDFKYLMFDDKLVTFSDTGKELGEFFVTIEPTKHRNIECFLVHANSHGAIDGVPCGTSITCYVTRKLETIEQHHHEYVNLENCPLDRKTNILRQETEYTVNRIITQGESIVRQNKSYPLDEMDGFISEGSNLLLHRLLIEKKMPAGDFQLISFDSESILCPAVYKGLEERTQTVAGTELRVYGIERTINSKQDLPTTWQSYFTADGHLTNRVQVGSPVGMKLAKVPEEVIRDQEPPKPDFVKRDIDIETDMQMYSKFMDRKEDIKGDHAVYMKHHPELKALLADFLQFLLLRKPNDVVLFAAEYFSAFSTVVPDATPYSSSNAPTPYPISRGNTRTEQLGTPT